MKKTLAVTLALIIGGCAPIASASINVVSQVNQPYGGSTKFCQEVYDELNKDTSALVPLIDSCLSGGECPTDEVLVANTKTVKATIMCATQGYVPKNQSITIANIKLMTSKLYELKDHFEAKLHELEDQQ